MIKRPGAKTAMVSVLALVLAVLSGCQRHEVTQKEAYKLAQDRLKGVCAKGGCSVDEFSSPEITPLRRTQDKKGDMPWLFDYRSPRHEVIIIVTRYGETDADLSDASGYENSKNPD